MENNTDAKAALIRHSSAHRVGVSQLAMDLRFSPARLIGLLGEMQEKGLLELDTVRAGRAGRPERLARVTPLGVEYMRAYDVLTTKTLMGSPSDLGKAAADGEYARRLASRGISSYDLFLELSAFAQSSGKAPG